MAMESPATPAPPLDAAQWERSLHQMLTVPDSVRPFGRWLTDSAPGDLPYLELLALVAEISRHPPDAQGPAAIALYGRYSGQPVDADSAKAELGRQAAVALSHLAGGS